MKTVYGAVITCLTSHCQCQSAGRPRAHKYTLSHSRAHNTHTAWYVWNESSSIMKPLAQAWPVLALSAMAVTIFCQHWLRLLSSWLHAKEFHAQSFPPLLLNKELNSAPKQIKWVYWGGGVRMWHAGRFCSTDFFCAPTLARCFSGDEKLARVRGAWVGVGDWILGEI